MAWHPNLHNRRIHPNSTCTTMTFTVPVPHRNLLVELATQFGCSRSEIVRRLIEAVASDELPLQALEASRSQNRRRALMRPYDPHADHAKAPDLPRSDARSCAGEPNPETETCPRP